MAWSYRGFEYSLSVIPLRDSDQRTLTIHILKHEDGRRITVDTPYNVKTLFDSDEAAEMHGHERANQIIDCQID